MRVVYAIFLGICFVISSAIMHAIDLSDQKYQAVRNECAHYDYYTGEFKWNVSDNALKGFPSNKTHFEGAPFTINNVCIGENCPDKKNTKKSVSKPSTESGIVVDEEP